MKSETVTLATIACSIPKKTVFVTKIVSLHRDGEDEHPSQSES